MSLLLSTEVYRYTHREVCFASTRKGEGCKNVSLVGQERLVGSLVPETPLENQRVATGPQTKKRGDVVNPKTGGCWVVSPLSWTGVRLLGRWAIAQLRGRGERATSRKTPETPPFKRRRAPCVQSWPDAYVHS